LEAQYIMGVNKVESLYRVLKEQEFWLKYFDGFVYSTK
jgi:hypothetical protein